VVFEDMSPPSLLAVDLLSLLQYPLAFARLG
jgi:hypothetical protein